MLLFFASLKLSLICKKISIIFFHFTYLILFTITLTPIDPIKMLTWNPSDIALLLNHFNQYDDKKEQK